MKIEETIEELHHALGYRAGVITVDDSNFSGRIKELIIQEEKRLMVIKIKVSEIAKDLGKSNKDIIEILDTYCGGPAKGIGGANSRRSTISSMV